MQKEQIIQLQFALFFDSIDTRPDKISAKIEDALDGIFDQMPTILPIPGDVPPEVPRVTMHSSNGLYVCNVANNRVDFIMNCINSGDSSSVDLTNFVGKILAFSNVVFGIKKISRFGMVGSYFYKDSNAAKTIQKKYLKNDLGDLEELNIRFNKRFESNGFTFNDVTEIQKGNASENNGPQISGIIVTRDMNNIPVKELKLEDLVSVIKSREEKFKISSVTELVL